MIRAATANESREYNSLDLGGCAPVSVGYLLLGENIAQVITFWIINRTVTRVIIQAIETSLAASNAMMVTGILIMEKRTLIALPNFSKYLKYL